MAHLTVHCQHNRLVIRSQDFCLTLNKTWDNQKVLFIMLRALSSPDTGKPLFTYQQLADVFGYEDRQNIQNFWQEFEHAGEDLLVYLQRKRKVDASVVEAVAEALRHDPLADASQLCQQVSTRLGRTDLSPANIRTALEEVPCSVIRPVLQHQWEEGRFHPKEEIVLQEALTALLSSSSSPRPDVTDDLVKLGMAPSLPADEMPVQRQQAAAVSLLLNPQATVTQVSGKLRLMVFALTLYYWNVPLSRLGLWLGVSPSTVLNWVTGLAVAMYPTIQAWIVSRTQAVNIALDEKWLKIRQTWHYWFVGLDEATGLPLVLSLLSTRTTWACCWVLVTLKRLGKRPRSIITDGLPGYAASLPVVFPRVKHLLCLFHHQQGVTRWLRDHAAGLPEQVVATLKRQMKRVMQTCDPRTVRRRLTRLAREEGAQPCGLESWIAQTTKRLGNLLPALRHNAFPRTTNSIERFFRTFQRFYKTRGGFHSVTSAKRELLLFIVVYVFTIQPRTGIAPIEQIIPQAKHMPLYLLLNDPFRYGLTDMCQAKRHGDDTHGNSAIPSVAQTNMIGGK